MTLESDNFLPSGNYINRIGESKGSIKPWGKGREKVTKRWSRKVNKNMA